MNEPERDEFSVYEFFADGTCKALQRFVSAKDAVVTAKHATDIATKHGIVRRVIITDGGDCVNFEWTYEKGVTYPENL